MARNPVIGGMSEEEIKDALLKQGIKAMQNIAGYIPQRTAFPLPDDDEFITLLHEVSGVKYYKYDDVKRLETRLAMYLYNKPYDRLNGEQTHVVANVYDFAFLCPFCRGTRKRRRCSCKNTGLCCTGTLKILANHYEENADWPFLIG